MIHVSEISNLCEAIFCDTEGILYLSLYNGNARWFFLSNNSKYHGSYPDNFDEHPLRKDYRYSWVLNMERNYLTNSNLFIKRTQPGPKIQNPPFIIPRAEEDKPLFKQIILTPNKIK